MSQRCPAGHGDFDAGVVRCPRCGERLVDLATRRAGDRGAAVRVAIAPNEPIAGFWVSVLAEVGIVALARPLGPGFGAWGSVATFEHELLVGSVDADEARLVIEDLEAAEDLPFEDEADA
jgi:hypothetical protein